MKTDGQSSDALLNLNLGNIAAAIFAAVVFCAAVFAPAAQAQTFQVIHTFANGIDGSIPLAGLTADRAGNLYGTASGGGSIGFLCGSYGCGTAFELKPAGSGWGLTPLYDFQGITDGQNPEGRMVLASDGALYGTTVNGGGYDCNYSNCGVAFRLTSPVSICKTVICEWNETVIYRFVGQPYAGNPSGPLVFDRAGNLYGSASQGPEGYGVVYELTSSRETWSEIDIAAPGDPNGGVVFGSDGNLYGTNAGDGYGGIYQLTQSGSFWNLNQLYSIINVPVDGYLTVGGVILDDSGNIYGSTVGEGPGGGGTIFELSAGNWNYSVLYGFTGGGGPEESLTMDPTGNLYGTTYADGAHGYGSVFKLSPSANGWIYNDLYDFTGGSDGANPVSNVVIDAQGNLYGTASNGGDNSKCVREYNRGCGTVWEITP